MAYSKKAIESHDWINIDYSICYYYNSETPKDTFTYKLSYRFNQDPAIILCYQDGNAYEKITKRNVKKIDFKNQVIVTSNKVLSLKNSYITARNDTESKFQFMPYYTQSLPIVFQCKHWLINVNTYRDTTIAGNSCREFIGNSRKFLIKNGNKGRFDIPLQYECHTWINNNTYQIDSIIAFNTTENNFRHTIKYRINNISFEDKSNFYDSIFDFNNSEYDKFSKNDDHYLPYNVLNTDETSLNNECQRYPIVNVLGDTIDIRMQKGWILLDLWMFGCGGCDNCFKTFKQEKDSLGCRILEKENIKLLAVNALSDNLEMINNYAHKYSMEDILYFSKGFNTKLALVNYAYPSYYLITPEKEIIWRSNFLGDYSEILEAKTNYEKQHQK